MSFVIRTATLDDHKDIVKLSKLSPYTAGLSSAYAVQFKSCYADRLMAVAVHRESAHMVGFVLIRPLKRSPLTMLDYMGVDPRAQRSAVGTLLLEWAKRSSPLPCIRLNVADANEPAQRFYQARGFKPTGKRGTDKDGGDWRELELTWGPLS